MNRSLAILGKSLRKEKTLTVIKLLLIIVLSFKIFVFNSPQKGIQGVSYERISFSLTIVLYINKLSQ